MLRKLIINALKLWGNFRVCLSLSDDDAEDIEAILERLEDMRMNNPRIPLINTKCSCESTVRKVRTNQNDLNISDEEDSCSSHSEDDDGNMITLF